MRLRAPLIALLLMACAAAPADALTSLHPEEAYPDDAPMLAWSLPATLAVRLPAFVTPAKATATGV